MTACIRWLAFGTALLLVPACGRAGGDAAGGASATTTVGHAAAAARAIQANASATDSILAAHGFTRAGFSDLMYEVAADPALARAYTEAIQ